MQRNGTMKKMKFLTAGLIAAMMVPAAAQAQTREIRNDRKELREEQRDLRHAQRYGDRDDVRDARRDVRDARRDLRESQRDWRRDTRYQNIAPRSAISSSASARRSAPIIMLRPIAPCGTAAGACRGPVAI